MLKSFPSASGRTVWVRDSGESNADAVKMHALGSVKRSRSVRLANSHTDASGNRWFMFKVTKSI